MSVKKCKVCGKFKNCKCKVEVQNFAVAVIEAEKQESKFEFKNDLVLQYFEATYEKLQENNIEITLVNDDLVVLTSAKKTIEIYFDTENNIFAVRSILNKFLGENQSKYYRNILKLKSLKATLSYSNCHLNM